MRFGTVGGRLALIVEGGAIDVALATRGRLPAAPNDAYDRWPDVLAWAAGASPSDATPFDEDDLGPPSPRPSQVFAIGLNYRSHAEESNVEPPDHPSTFTKFPTCIAGPNDTVELPSAKVDWEVELVIVIGRPAFRVTAEAGWHHVAGLTVGQDLSEREVQLRPPVPQFSLGKSFPAFGPTGPYLVTPDAVDDPDDLALSCTLNGEVVQASRTSQLFFPVPELIARLSAIVALEPGDLIFTGTPGGVGIARKPQRFLSPGDELISTVEGVGTLCTRLVAPSTAAGVAAL